jgi:hypothetical protein
VEVDFWGGWMGGHLLEHKTASLSLISVRSKKTYIPSSTVSTPHPFKSINAGYDIIPQNECSFDKSFNTKSQRYLYFYTLNAPS